MNRAASIVIACVLGCGGSRGTTSAPPQPQPMPGPAPVAMTWPGELHAPAARKLPVIFGAVSEQSIEASRYASPCQKNALSVVFGMSCSVPGVGLIAALNSASSAEFQNPPNEP